MVIAEPSSAGPAIHLALSQLGTGSLVGDLETGYIVVPHAKDLRAELDVRREKTDRLPAEWVRVFRLGADSAAQVT